MVRNWTCGTFAIIAIAIIHKTSSFDEDINADGCNPLIYRVLDDHRRSISYSPTKSTTASAAASSSAAASNQYSLVDYEDRIEDEAFDISIAQANHNDMVCDDVLPYGWYRFLTYGLSRDMATTCPGPGRCGTVAPVWLDMTTAVNLTSNAFSVDACVSWGFGDGGFDNFDCCLFTLPVRVKMCQGFRVYYLGPTQACDIAYCSAPATEPQMPAGNAAFLGEKMTSFENNQDMTPPYVSLEVDNGDDYLLKCTHFCRLCRTTWVEINAAGERSTLEITGTKLRLSGYEIKQRHKIVCVITHDLKSEESPQFPLGITFGPQSLLIKSSHSQVLELFQQTPHLCKSQNCTLKIGLLAQDLMFSECLVEFRSPNICQFLNGSQGLFCNKKAINISPITSSYWNSNHEYSPGSIKIAIFEDPTVPIYHDFIDYLVENQLTSQCHVISAGHLVSVDQKRYQIAAVESGTFVLHKNAEFESLLQLQNCGLNMACACGLKVTDSGESFHISICNKLPFIENPWPNRLKSARNGTVLFVDLPSGRFFRIDIQPFGLSITLQSIGSDFKSSAGLCGNFDGNSSNEFEDQKTALDFAEKWRLEDATLDNRIIELRTTDHLCHCELGESYVCSNSKHSKIDHMLDHRIIQEAKDIHLEPPISHSRVEKLEFSRGRIFDICTDVIINSSIAVACGPFFDRDIMHAMDICLQDVSATNDENMARLVLPLIESQCEAALKRKSQHVHGPAILRALNCPNDCYGNGVCLDLKECRCNHGYYGYDCKLRSSAPGSLDKSKTPKLCEISTSTCGSIPIFGSLLSPQSSCFFQFDGESSRQEGIFRYLSENRASCQVAGKAKIGNLTIFVQDHHGHIGDVNVKIYDINCEHCTVINSRVECMHIENACKYQDSCFSPGSIHPGNNCLQCFDGKWLPDKQNKATSELNKKFKVIKGDLFNYDLPSIDNATKFELTSGPFGASLSTNGTLKWQASSNLIDDAWNELFIIKAKSVCNYSTLIEVTVHVVSCDCLNGGTCLLVLDEPLCVCKPGFKGKSCEIMDDPCMVPRCNFGTCIPDGINFGCICDHGYTGPLCATPIQPSCECFKDVECLDNGQCGPCPSGYTGNGFNCTRIRPCQYDPCHPGVECFAIGEDDFVCGHCPPGLTGNGKKCYESSHDFFAQLCNDEETNPCFDKSMCQIDLKGSVNCKACPKGFRGDGITCVPVQDVDNPCDSTSTNPCYPGSDCKLVNGILTCGPCPANMTGDGKMCTLMEPCLGCPGSCPPGFQWQVDRCVLEIEFCHPNPCFPGVQCEMQLGQPVCGSCPRDMIGDGFNCSRQVPKDHCASDPCFPGTECYNFHNRFKCGPCPEGFTGNGVHCSAANDPCSPNPCHPGVACITVWKGQLALFSCGMCPDGMVGDGLSCTYTNPCQSSPCHPGVVCSPNGDTFQCGPCPSGMVGNGIICRSELTPCDPSPCHPDVECQLLNGTFTCGACPPGSEGDGFYCKEIDDCQPGFCFPGVDCVDLKAPLRGYKCGPCPQGFIGNGKTCKKKVIFAVPCPDVNHCYPGVNCVMNNSSKPFITCGDCPKGYKGDGIKCKPLCSRCDESSEVCISPEICQAKCFPSCQNGGKCSKSGMCKCPSDFEGSFCQDHKQMPRLEKRLNRGCSKKPCQNGGTCEAGGKCTCPPGFRGHRCQKSSLLERFLLPPQTEVSKCKRKCQNGGICSKTMPNRCKCTPEYRGRYCQKAKCPGGCRNGGLCISPGICSCQPGFEGKNCKNVTCDPPCRNGGICKPSGRCKCPKTYKGRYCEKPRKMARFLLDF